VADDGKKFDIEVGTKADTSGLEAVERELKAVENAGKAAVNPMTDGSMLRAAGEIDEATTATRELAGELERAAGSATDVAAELKDVGEKVEDVSKEKKGRGFDDLFKQQRLQGIGQELKQLAGTLGEVARKFADTEAGQDLFSGMSEEVKVFGTTALTVASGVAQGYAQGGPIGAAIGGLNGLIKTVADSFIESNERIKAAEKDLETAQLAHAARQRQRKIDATTREIEQRIDAETLAIQRQNAALERNRQLRAAASGLNDAAGEQADQQALAAGASPALVAAGAAERALQAKLAELEAGLTDKITQTNSLVAAAKEAEADLEDLRAQNRKTGGLVEEIKEAEKQFNEKMEKAIQATAETDTLEQTLALNKQELLTRFQTGVQGIAAGVEGDLSAEVEKAIGSISAKSGELSGLQKQSLDTMVAAVKDGIIKPEEIGPLKQALENFSNASNTKDKEVIETIQGTLKSVEGTVREIGALKRQMLEIQTKVGSL
jgi:chromosome segregation ATPase